MTCYLKKQTHLVFSSQHTQTVLYHYDW